MNPLTNDMYEETKKQSKWLALRMRSGTGVNKILAGEDSATHYMDALERFQKDHSHFDRQRREEQKQKKQQEIEKRRLQQLERQNKRWEVVEEEQQIKRQRMARNMDEVQKGRRRTANSNGLAYNPINLTYDSNPEGHKLKNLDEDNQIRGYVRAFNMDHHGNSVYNPLNGEQRKGVTKIVPKELTDRYKQRLNDFQQSRRLVAPQTSNQNRKNIFQYY